MKLFLEALLSRTPYPRGIPGGSVAYISAAEFAAKAVRRNPEKSDRAIAAEIGVSDFTVRKARKGTARNLAVEKRTGRDGKTRKLPTTKFEGMKARAEAVIRLFGAPISHDLRMQLVEALTRLPSTHPAERIRVGLGMTWDQLIVAAAAQSAAA